jgi:hypothetical protein
VRDGTPRSNEPSPGPTGTATQGEYLCPLDDAALCQFAFELAAAFHPPGYGLARLADGTPWAAPEYFRQLADTVETAFRFKRDGGVRLEDEGDIRLVSIACPVAGELARCDGPAFVLTFADVDPRSAPSTAFGDASTLMLVFERPGDGGRPILTGPLRNDDFEPLITIVGGMTHCHLLGLEDAVAACDALLFRSTLLPPIPSGAAELAGLPLQQLRVGEPVPLPDDTVLFFNPTCYGCDGGIRTYRAYRNDDGLVVDEVSPTTSAAAGYQMARAIEPSGRRIAVGSCEGEYCGGHAEPSPDAKGTMWLSEDGGITWENRGGLPVWSSFLGFLDGQVMVSTWDSTTQSLREWLWHSGDPIPGGPVPGAERFQRASGETYWAAEDGIGGHSRIYDDAGNLVVDRVDPLYRTSLAAVGVDGTLYLSARPLNSHEGEGDPRQLVIAIDEQGQPLAAYAWATGDLRLIAPIAPGVFLGNALFPVDPLSPGTANFRPALIDLNEGVVSPIAELPPDQGTGLGGYAFTVHAITGDFLRIADAAACASVRAQPGLAADEVDCLAPRVLVRDRGETRDADGVAWRAVTTPAGTDGWVLAAAVAE